MRDPAPHGAQLFYRASLRYLPGSVFVLLCRPHPGRHREPATRLERVQRLPES